MKELNGRRVMRLSLEMATPCPGHGNGKTSTTVGVDFRSSGVTM
jgi:hypothetical protein